MGWHGFFHSRLLIIAGVVIGWLGATISSSAESATKEALKLIAVDATSGGKNIPKGAAPLSLHKGPEKRIYDEGDPDIIVLPKMEVTVARVSPFERRLEELEAEQSREDRSSTPTALDSFLNSSRFSLGAETASARAAKAQSRVEIMNWERMLLIAILAAKTPEEESRIRDEIRIFRGLRR